MTFRLRVFDDELLSRSRYGTVWGRIYFEFGEECFPDAGWTDLPIAFVSVWLDSLMEVLDATTRRVSVPFVDGPLRVDVTVEAEGQARLEFIHKDVPKTAAIVLVADLLRDAICAGEQLISICKRYGWSTGPDYVNLTASINKAIRLLPN